jgi:formylglycine-generating enzyme required for sulfatase activity
LLAGIRSRLTYANAMATIAVFGVLAGGIAVAANTAPKNSVVTKSIKDGAVTFPKLGCKGNNSEDKMVRVGPTCIDKYENSLWTAPKGGTQLITPQEISGACPFNGQPLGDADCEDFYARSVPGVLPAGDVTWHQAQQALANSGKRLPSNSEWQTAVSGTPDSIACNVETGPGAGRDNTGANPDCVSRFGAFDMVGNVNEMVGDWGEEAPDCENFTAGFGSDSSCYGRGDGDSVSRFPMFLLRGGSFSGQDGGTNAGPFHVSANDSLGSTAPDYGFRGAR